MAVTVAAKVPAPERRRTSFWLIFLVLVLFLCNIAAVVAEIDDRGALLAGAVAAILPAIIYSVVVILLDRYEREPLPVLFGTFLWGALVAALISGIVNAIFQMSIEESVGQEMASLTTAVISAPLIEEFSKGLVVLLLFLFLRHEFDNVLDGIVYGSLVGIGFAMTENVTYLARAYTEGMFELSFFIRVILMGLAGHAAFTATTGAGLGYARQGSGSPALRIIVPPLAWLAAVFEHASWNLIGSRLVAIPFAIEAPTVNPFLVAALIMLVITSPAIITLVVVITLAWRREGQVIDEQLRDEVTAGVITPDEYARLSSSRRRRAAEWRALRDRGIRAWRNVAALHQAATELAFRKWHLSRGERPKGAQNYLSADDYRRLIGEIRARA